MRWTINRLPWLLFSGILVLGLVQSPAGETFSYLPLLLSFGAFVFWLASAARSQESYGRRWVQSPVCIVPFLVLGGYAAIIPLAPVTEKEFGATAFEIAKVTSMASGLSYLLVWDHLAISLSRIEHARSRALGVYAITLFLSFMPPFGILWFHLFRGRRQNRAVGAVSGRGHS
jgi:hypothetical protein